MLELASNISEWYDKQYNKLLNNYCDEIKNIIQEKYGIKSCTKYDYYDFGLIYYLKDAEHKLSEEEALKINSECRYTYVNIPESSISPIFTAAIIMNNHNNINNLDFRIANVHKNLTAVYRDLSVDKNALNENKELFEKAVKTGVEWLEKMFLDYGVYN